MSKRNTILITGSSGMLGIDLCQELKLGYDVIGLDLFRCPKPEAQNSRAGLNLPCIMCDITDRKSVQAIVAKISPDIVIHCAAWTDVDGCELDSKKAYKINSDGTRNVALACKACGAVMVYISTDFVFNGRKKRPYVETDKTGPLSIYGDSKLKGEAFVRKTLDRYLILRTSWLYGRHGKNFVDTIVAKAKTERSLKVVRDQVGSPTYTGDLAKAMHSLLDKLTLLRDVRNKLVRGKIYGIYHVSNTGKVSWFDYARTIAALTKSRVNIVPITSRELGRPANRPAISVMDSSKFSTLTSYRMRGWKKALREYILGDARSSLRGAARDGV